MLLALYEGTYGNYLVGTGRYDVTGPVAEIQFVRNFILYYFILYILMYSKHAISTAVLCMHNPCCGECACMSITTQNSITVRDIIMQVQSITYPPR